MKRTRTGPPLAPPRAPAGRAVQESTSRQPDTPSAVAPPPEREVLPAFARNGRNVLASFGLDHDSPANPTRTGSDPLDDSSEDPDTPVPSRPRKFARLEGPVSDSGLHGTPHDPDSDPLLAADSEKAYTLQTPSRAPASFRAALSGEVIAHPPGKGGEGLDALVSAAESSPAVFPESPLPLAKRRAIPADRTSEVEDIAGNAIRTPARRLHGPATGAKSGFATPGGRQDRADLFHTPARAAPHTFSTPTQNRVSPRPMATQTRAFLTDLAQTKSGIVILELYEFLERCSVSWMFVGSIAKKIHEKNLGVKVEREPDDADILVSEAVKNQLEKMFGSGAGHGEEAYWDDGKLFFKGCKVDVLYVKDTGKKREGDDYSADNIERVNGVPVLPVKGLIESKKRVAPDEKEEEKTRLDLVGLRKLDSIIESLE